MEENKIATMTCVVCEKEKNITSFIIYGRKGFRRKVCKFCLSQGLTMKDIKTVETKYCEACYITKPINQFYRNNAISTGYERRCKNCHNNRVKINKEKSKYSKKKPYEQEWKNYFNIVGVTKEDYKRMFIFLNKSGYSLENNDIHEQFCKKWGLTPQKPKKPFKNTFSPKDFNLA
jgi:NMD protein affecting ribosome stability and mRNA decay